PRRARGGAPRDDARLREGPRRQLRAGRDGDDQAAGLHALRARPRGRAPGVERADGRVGREAGLPRGCRELPREAPAALRAAALLVVLTSVSSPARPRRSRREAASTWWRGAA